MQRSTLLLVFSLSLSLPVPGDSLSESRISEREPGLENGRELFEQKRYEEALVKFEEILKHDTTDEEALRLRTLCRDLIAKDAHNLALRSARDGEVNTAVAYARKALKYRPNYLEASELIKALRAKKDAKNMNKSKELYNQSLNAYLAGDHEKALELAKQAQELRPNEEAPHRMPERLSQRDAATP
jgi:tetratricopeptide (TPR) repeat protein